MKPLITGLLLCLLFYTSTMPILNAQNSLSVFQDSTTAALDEVYKMGYLNGFSVILANKDEILYQNSFGYADTENNAVYSDETIQNIASVTKTFIGIALLKAQELNLLKLDDPIDDYLDFKVENPHYPNLPITIRQLATHTSSILDSEKYYQKAYILAEEKTDATPDHFNPAESSMPIRSFLKQLLSEEGQWYSKDGFSKTKPGSTFQYTNVGATLAAYIIERATKKDFHAFVKEAILEPLGMQSSSLLLEDIEAQKHARLYTSNKEQLPNYNLITYPDGGMRTSASDIGKYLQELIKGKLGKGTLLTKEGYQEFFKHQLNASHFSERDADFPYNDEYNSGILIGFSGTGNIGHTGSDPGVMTALFINSDSTIGRFVMTNTTVDSSEGFQALLGIMKSLDYLEQAILRNTF